MLYKRTNKAGNLVELLSVGEVSFLRAKLDDRLYKTLLILKSGEIVHVNLTQQELDELVRKVELVMDNYGATLKKELTAGQPLEGPSKQPADSPDQTSIDTMLDDLKADSQTESQE
jgi:hypothetical protein